MPNTVHMPAACLLGVLTSLSNPLYYLLPKEETLLSTIVNIKQWLNSVLFFSIVMRETYIRFSFAQALLARLWRFLLF